MKSTSAKLNSSGTARWRLEPVVLFPFLQEAHVQLPQLFEEAPVGDDPPPPLHMFHGVHQRHVLADHEVGEEERG